ncbi:helix-turn-helix domain-containing protein [Pedobacter ginsengiterrae]|uniref:Helix-turn-helix domain-containing protein n=2 Tax=Pedobacter ginsengiterrae TaxID=871696 RepID=A0ABP7PGI1_9SPHI
MDESCGMVHALSIIGGRWKMLILYALESQNLRFSEIRENLQTVSERMLSRQLRELERDGMIHRHVYAEVPVRVEYSLTETAASLIPIWHSLERWGDEMRNRNQVLI